MEATRYGPFAALRRANKVAYDLRLQGYRTQFIYGGTVDYRLYFVDVR